MKRKILIILVMAMLLSSIAYASDYSRVTSLGLIQGSIDWNKKITREEMATIAIRLIGKEQEGKAYNKNIYKDVSGWSTGYINLGNELNIMKGTSSNTFNPKANISYIELLTIIMRTLGYEDKIDFVKYPEDYYQKSIEIGLANMYIDPKEKVTKEVVAITLDKALDLHLKNTNTKLIDKIENKSITTTGPIESVEEERITVENIKFNTNIVGLFSGTVNGIKDFEGYKVVLSSKDNSFSKESNIEFNGKFTIDNFNIDTLTKLSGYKYKIVDTKGGIVYENQL